MSATIDTNQENPGKAIAKRLLTDDPDLHTEAVWMLQREHYLMDDRTFQVFLGGIKARLRSKTDSTTEYQRNVLRFAQCVWDATGHPLTDWIAPKRKGKKIPAKG